MDKKVTSIVAYIGILGWSIAFFFGDKEGAKFHLNQALVLVILNSLFGILGIIPFLGGILTTIIGIVFLVFSIIGIVYACKGEEKELPLIGSIRIMN